MPKRLLQDVEGATELLSALLVGVCETEEQPMPKRLLQDVEGATELLGTLLVGVCETEEQSMPKRLLQVVEVATGLLAALLEGELVSVGVLVKVAELESKVDDVELSVTVGVTGVLELPVTEGVAVVLGTSVEVVDDDVIVVQPRGIKPRSLLQLVVTGAVDEVVDAGVVLVGAAVVVATVESMVEEELDVAVPEMLVGSLDDVMIADELTLELLLDEDESELLEVLVSLVLALVALVLVTLLPLLVLVPVTEELEDEESLELDVKLTEKDETADEEADELSDVDNVVEDEVGGGMEGKIPKSCPAPERENHQQHHPRLPIYRQGPPEYRAHRLEASHRASLSSCPRTA
ncbi:hypothetical protein NEOLEDRAFT_897983 [Neolentinus lepideus HHB14362 ss-1]|uniref:Uncharacterized protein n=1 Tax=Neolentinus lepideus HHB14362 ss-1 TaxID=1314782 RepID=A0A165NR72_9AGAM|nr:hypothetical protein NEOLEDRAFT_897983 [Neolentinus lepideus HHB14362 ss-1]